MRLVDADEVLHDATHISVFRCGLANLGDLAIALCGGHTVDAVPVVRCKDCKKRNKKKCPLVMVRFDVKTNGTIKEVLEQNYVNEDFWCKDGERKDNG